MTEEELKTVADDADMIVQGYAFTRKGDYIAVLNLYKPNRAMLLSKDGKMLESSMDVIEQALVEKIWAEDSEFMEVASA
ncbi:MAG: hypothetical protein Q4D21_06225 [Phascolarctobacterium sp.]|nr:hypothetical protein [Phascolarctobacterium sp.]